MAGVEEVVFGLPPAAVEEDQKGELRVRLGIRLWQPEVAELTAPGAVRDAVVGDGRGAGEEIHSGWMLAGWAGWVPSPPVVWAKVPGLLASGENLDAKV